MFLGTIGICTTAIRITFEIYDKRLEHKKLVKEAPMITKKRIDKIQEQRLIEHISSFKVVESHKIRKNHKYYNHGHNILIFFDTLPNFLYTTSKTKRDY